MIIKPGTKPMHRATALHYYLHHKAAEYAKRASGLHMTRTHTDTHMRTHTNERNTHKLTIVSHEAA